MKIVSKPEIKELEAKNVAYVLFVGNYLGNSKIFEELFYKLCSWAGQKQLMGKGR